MDIAGVALPTSEAALAAAEVARQYCSPSLANHCTRSFVWAASYGATHGIPFDAELLYVAAMLHDLGLVAEFDSHTIAFEEAGGHVAWVFGAGLGWPVERRRRVSDVIVRHMWSEVDADVDPEGHLLGIATSLDISGSQADDWAATFRAEVVQLLPRLGLADEFLRCFEDQADRKPDSSAAAAVRAGIGDRIVANPLDGPAGHEPA